MCRIKRGLISIRLFVKFLPRNDPNGDCFAEILTAEGTRETFTVKQSVNVNGEKCNLEQLFSV